MWILWISMTAYKNCFDISIPVGCTAMFYEFLICITMSIADSIVSVTHDCGGEFVGCYMGQLKCSVKSLSRCQSVHYKMNMEPRSPKWEPWHHLFYVGQILFFWDHVILNLDYHVIVVGYMNIQLLFSTGLLRNYYTDFAHWLCRNTGASSQIW
jgi:hypothetical protein